MKRRYVFTQKLVLFSGKARIFKEIDRYVLYNRLVIRSLEKGAIPLL